MGVMSKLAGKIINGLFLLVMVWICAIALFGAGFQIPDWVRKSFLLPNIVLLPIVLVLLIAASGALKGRKLPIGIIAAVIFILQFLVVYTYFFRTDWDAGTVLGTAMSAAYKGEIRVPEPYYSYYVNNIMVHCLEYLFLKFTIVLGIHSEFTATALMVLVLCALSSITGVLVYDITGMLMPDNRSASNISFLLYILLVMTSPWIPIIYTDSLALIVPALMIWIYLKAGKRDKKGILGTVLFSALISFIGMMSYHLKATAFITFIGICVTEIYMFLVDASKGNRSEIKRYVLKAVVAVAVVFVSARLFTALYTACGIELDPEARCPFTHYLMMGFNDDEAGVFNFPDSDYSAMEATYQSRYDSCLSGAKDRIKKLLPYGIFKFEARKTYVNYHDGTFGYGIEGIFYSSLLEDRVPGLSSFFKEIFWDTGSAYPVFATILQGIWMTVLFLGVFFAFYKSSGQELLIKVTLVGIFLFLSLFEARARYVFIYVPLYIVAAAIGFEKIRVIIRKEG